MLKQRNLVVELMVDAGAISLSITDNGKGFDMEKVKTKKGVGLHNIANRTELFNGKMNIVTSPGNGCTFNIHHTIVNNVKQNVWKRLMC